MARLLMMPTGFVQEAAGRTKPEAVDVSSLEVLETLKKRKSDVYHQTDNDVTQEVKVSSALAEERTVV